MAEFEIKDEDLGLEDLLDNIRSNAKPLAVVVGITEDSPKDQFRMAQRQEFEPNTAGTLLRIPVDRNKDILEDRIADIARRAVIDGIDPVPGLLELGEQVKAEMGKQTDPPPQLRDAIIVKVER